jgi:16S rRNA (cytosine967-C5)-methyltransferase
MEPRAFSLATQVIGLTTPERPADAVLRLVLREAGHVSPRAGADTSRTVFTYYRWIGWLDRSAPVLDQIRQAMALAARFRDNPETFSDEEMLRAVPEWVRAEIDCSPAWLRALQRERPLWLRARPGKAFWLSGKFPSSHLADQPLAPDAVRYDGKTDLFKTIEFQTGQFEIQDIASQAVGTLCRPRHGDFWWDACAGEGGKTLHLCDLMENKGVVWATDRAEWRLKQLQLRMKRAKFFNFRVAVWDGGPVPPREGKFNGVLVDAPCSGLGTWQKNPHARWTTRPEDVAELAAIQLRLLDNVADSLKNGGRLVYAVCTLARSETTDVVRAFSAKHPELIPCPLTENGPAERWLWPQDLGGNGMFVASWKKPKNRTGNDDSRDEQEAADA